MKTKYRNASLASAIGAALLSVALPPAFAAELRTAARPIEGHYIVVLKDGSASLANESSRIARVGSVANAIAATHRIKLTQSFDHVLRGFAAQADDAALARLLADPRVAYVQEDGWVSPSATQTSAPWGLDRIDQNARPLNGTYVYENVVTRPHVYVIDTGVLTGHTQFTGRMGNGVSFISDGLGTSDCNGHGTHVAGIAAGTTWGVAKNAIVHPVRIAGCGGLASFSNMVAGMNWVAANRIGPAVANLSYNATQIEPTLDTAATNLINSGVSLVVAAGNQNVNSCQFSPGRVPGAITVGSTASNDTKAFTSAYGPCLDVFAPGVGIPSAWYTGTSASATLDGTSMAAPHVAGAIARYINIYPATTPAQMSSVMAGAATQNVVINAGAGSPNRLLFIPEMPGTAPTVTSFVCPDYGNSGGGTYWCQIAYNSATPATVRWPGGSAGNVYIGTCSAGSRPTVSVNVSNAYGTATRSATFTCPTGPIP
ncbi:MAG: S8 family peptidase [Xanthomonadaceae bacterium]|nr:S8 family peptidase [Xanthomonadaceae bacterium]